MNIEISIDILTEISKFWDTEKIGSAKFLTCIRDVPSWNMSRDTGCPDRFSVVSLSSFWRYQIATSN
jgi:hypothetical protein